MRTSVCVCVCVVVREPGVRARVCLCVLACVRSLCIRSERSRFSLKSPRLPSDCAAPFLARSGAPVRPDPVSQIQRFGCAKCGQTPARRPHNQLKWKGHLIRPLPTQTLAAPKIGQQGRPMICGILRPKMVWNTKGRSTARGSLLPRRR